nr:MAG TPA: hypothetical protein [Caudoviricetes sp.]
MEEHRDWELSEELQDAIRYIEEYTRSKIVIYSIVSFASGALVSAIAILFIMWGGL